MKLGAYLRIRGRRGWTLSGLGPNEARILFDLLLAAVASAAALLFLRTFAPAVSTPVLGTLVFLPAAFLGAASAAGIYSYLKLAPSTTKAGALAASAVVTALAGWLVGLPPAVVVLWTLLTAPTAIVARLLLGLPYSRRTPVSALVVTRHGPVLVIGGAGLHRLVDGRTPAPEGAPGPGARPPHVRCRSLSRHFPVRRTSS